MDRKRKILTIFAPTLLVILLILIFNLSFSSSKSIPLTSSRKCKECHLEIYNHWKNAMHSMSIEDPIFKASYMESYFNTSGQAKYLCLRCHAPLTLLNNDYDLKQDITKEGVTCDFCHSIKQINLNNKEAPFEILVGKIKRGPLSNLSSPVHETVPSLLFKSSELCAGCHEYTNNQGITILGTYSEWKTGPYPEKKIQCQNCHMPLVPGKIVKSTIKASKQKQINLHAISASHSTDQLKKALKVKIQNIKIEKDIIYIVVAVTNVGSGHWVPTGIPSRKLILTVEVKSPTEYFHQQRVYQKIIQDESGQEIKKECEAFLKAAKITFDNRIKPKETRIERFSFVLPQNKKITVSARVDYLYKTNILKPTEMRVKMAEDSKSISK